MTDAREVCVGTNGILLTVLLVAASVLCLVGMWAVFEAGRASRSLRALADRLDSRLTPLLEKADVTIDALNAELLRVDAIVSRIEGITDRIESTSRTVQGVASAPAEIVTDIADRVRRAWKRHQAESAAKDSEDPGASSESAASPESAHDEAAATPST